MSSAKITELSEVTIVDPLNDWFVMVDTSDTTMAASGTTKKVLPSNIPVGSGTGIVVTTSGIPTTVAAPTGLILGDSDSQVVSNKRINPRIFTVPSTGTATPDVSTTDHYIITGQTSSLTVSVPTGTPINGQRLLYTFSDNGTQRLIQWNAIHRAISVTLPTGTVPSGVIYVGEVYNQSVNRWDVLAVGSGV